MDPNNIAGALSFYGLLAMISIGALHLGYIKDFHVLFPGVVTQRLRCTIVLLSQLSIVVIAGFTLQLGSPMQLLRAWMLCTEAGFFGWVLYFMISLIPCSPLFTATALYEIRHNPAYIHHKVWRRGTYVTRFGKEVYIDKVQNPDGRSNGLVNFKPVNKD